MPSFNSEVVTAFGRTWKSRICFNCPCGLRFSWSMAPAGNASKAALVGAKTVYEPSLFRLVSNPAAFNKSARMEKLLSAAAISIIVPALLVVVLVVAEVAVAAAVDVVVEVDVTGVVSVTVVVLVTGAVTAGVVLVVFCVAVTGVVAAGALVGAGVGCALVVAPVPSKLRAGS